MKLKCIAPGCTNTHADHRWGKIKASSVGWFSTKDGKDYCPEHIPEWVAAWRARKSGEKNG